MSKYRIRIFSSFCDCASTKAVYERLCETDLMDNYGPDKEIYIVGPFEPYTHAIIMNTPIVDVKVPKENVVGLAFEPPEFLALANNTSFMAFAKEYIHKYLVGSADGLPAPFKAGYSFMWHITPPRTIPQKDRMMSIMVSDKSQAPGHKYRHALVQSILNSRLPIDIYGRGCKFYANDNRLRGQFNDNEPYEKYHFHICIENFQTPHYISEKYTNAILWGTTPIYWGATEADPEITIALSGNIQKDMELLTTILYEPIKYRRFFSQSEVRPKINLLRNLDELFSKDNI